jgi:hypothetical protein
LVAAKRCRPKGRLYKTQGGAAALRYHLHFTPTGASWLNPVER